MVYYLTYAEYEDMGGTLDETLFNSLVLTHKVILTGSHLIVFGKKSGVQKMLWSGLRFVCIN